MLWIYSRKKIVCCSRTRYKCVIHILPDNYQQVAFEKQMDVLDHVLLYLKNTGMQVNSVKCELDQNSNIYLKCLVMWEVIKTHHYRVRAKIAIKTSKKNIIYHISLGWLISTGNCIIEGNICWIPWVNYQEGIPF